MQVSRARGSIIPLLALVVAVLGLLSTSVWNALAAKKAARSLKVQESMLRNLELTKPLGPVVDKVLSVNLDKVEGTYLLAGYDGQQRTVQITQSEIDQTRAMLTERTIQWALAYTRAIHTGSDNDIGELLAFYAPDAVIEKITVTGKGRQKTRRLGVRQLGDRIRYLADKYEDSELHFSPDRIEFQKLPDAVELRFHQEYKAFASGQLVYRDCGEKVLRWSKDVQKWLIIYETQVDANLCPNAI